MIASNGTPKLCDLGLARIRNVDESELYEPGTTLGSRRYMSPEQARGLEGIDARSDIYSLGLTLFFMLTGVPPFSDVPKEEVMIEHIRGLLEWPADVNPNLSEEASAMVWRMAAKEPDRRPQSALQAADELASARGETPRLGRVRPRRARAGRPMDRAAEPRRPGRPAEPKPHPARSGDDEPTSEFKAPPEI